MTVNQAVTGEFQEVLGTETAAPAATAAPEAKRSIFANRNLRLLWAGESISLLGDQFYMVALPWLVLQMTGSALAVGTILAVAGIPRAVLMLVGGVLSDRLSPRLLMIASNGARVIITGLLTLLVATGSLQVWMLYAFSLAFGIADAFFQPAYMAVIPNIVEEDDLGGANATLQGTALLVSAVGPGIAGVIVKAIGMPFSFLVDTLSFAVSTLTAGAMKLRRIERSAEDARRNMLDDIREAALYVWHDDLLRPLMLIVAVINFLFNGPFTVGPALMAKTRFVEGSIAFGVLLSAFGVGSLIGMALAGVAKPKRFSLISLLSLGVAGVCVALSGFTTSLWLTAVMFLVIGASVGFTNLVFITWLQKRIAKEMMGRVMSMVMLASLGLMPIASSIGGIIAEISLPLLFAGSGVLLVLTSILALSNPRVRRLGVD